MVGRFVTPFGPARGLWIVLAFLIATSLATEPWRTPVPGPPILQGAQVDPRVLAILQRSCQDCHSEVTRYPWYSYVAPASWLVRNDINGGRERMNLSRWSSYSVVRKERFLSEIANQVKDRDMPLSQYTLIHRDARLSDADVDAIFRWTQSERARLIADTQTGAR